MPTGAPEADNISGAEIGRFTPARSIAIGGDALEGESRPIEDASVNISFAHGRRRRYEKAARPVKISSTLCVPPLRRRRCFGSQSGACLIITAMAIIASRMFYSL